MANEHGQAGFFDATIWSTIIRARDGNEVTRLAALERMLTRYRQPIFRHILASLRGDQRTPENAEDLTQGFIAQCLRLEFLKNVSPEKGRFRTFIRECIKRYLRDRHLEASAGKRGGGQSSASLDEVDDEGRPRYDPADTTDPPGEVLDREWALTVLAHSMEALGKECRAGGRAQLFDALQGHLGRAPDPGSASEIGARLGLKEGAIHVAMHRLRGRLGEMIREVILETVGNDGDWREELRYLIELLGRNGMSPSR